MPLSELKEWSKVNPPPLPLAFANHYPAEDIKKQEKSVCLEYLSRIFLWKQIRKRSNQKPFQLKVEHKCCALKIA